MKIKKLLIILVTLFGFVFYAKAQSIIEQYTINNSPLPTNVISCLVWNATNQILWIGTEEGLASYRPTTQQWEVYTMNNSDLPDNTIRSLAIDAQQRLWIGTLSGGLANFDGQIWRIFDQSNSDLPDNFIHSIHITPDQNMWIGSTGGATHINPNGSMTTYYISIPAVTLNNVTDTYVQTDGTVWFTTINAGLVQMSTGNFSSFTATTSPLTDNTNLAICATNNGETLWLASPFAGWNAFTPPNTWHSYNTINSNIASNFFQDIVANNAGQILGGSTNAGVVIFTPQDNTWTTISSSNSTLLNDDVRALALQNDSVIWVGTAGGLALLQIALPTNVTPASNDFEVYINYDDQQNLWQIQENSGKATLNLSIYNILGEKIVDKIVSPQSSIDIPKLPTGIYICQIKDPTSNYTYNQKVWIP